MIGGISNTSISYSQNWPVVSNLRQDAQQTEPDVRTQTIPKAQPEMPVQPVDRVTAAPQVVLDKTDMLRRLDTDAAAMLVRSRIQYTDDAESADPASESAREVFEDSECETCKRRKYQDGSDDPGVSFKTPTSVSPDMASTAVRGHENEHVVREQVQAELEDRKVVDQSVTYYNAICPECGRIYMSGGETRTVTAADEETKTDGQMLYPVGLGKAA